MTGFEPSIIFGTITAAGTIVTILVVIWNDGRTKGEIKQQITALQKDVLRQNGNGSDLAGKVEHIIINKVEKGDCNHLHTELSNQITCVHGRIDDLYTQRQESENRILTAIRTPHNTGRSHARQTPSN